MTPYWNVSFAFQHTYTLVKTSFLIWELTLSGVWWTSTSIGSSRTNCDQNGWLFIYFPLIVLNYMRVWLRMWFLSVLAFYFLSSAFDGRRPLRRTFYLLFNVAQHKSSTDFLRTDTSSFVPCMDCCSAKKQTRQLSYTYAGTTGFYMIKLDEIGYPVFLNSCRGVYEF